MFLLSYQAEAQTHVQFNFKDPAYGVSQTTNRLVILQAESGNAQGSSVVFLPFRLTGYTDTNGSITFSNLYGSAIAGWYHVQLPAPPQRADLDIWVQSTNLGLIQGSTIIGTFGSSTYPSGAWAWSAQTSDLRYSQSTNSLASYVQLGQLNSASNAIVLLIPSTNSLATTNLLLSYATTNYANGLTNNFTSIVYSNPASYTTPNGVTNIVLALANINNLATTNYVNSSVTVATNALASTNQLNSAIQSATNSVAQTNWVGNNFTLISTYGYGTNWVTTNLLSQLNSASNVLALAKQPASTILTNLAITGAFTNKLAAGQNFQLTTNLSGDTVFLNATNQTFLTNGMTATAFLPSGSVVLTNQLSGLTNGFIGPAITNGFATLQAMTNYAYPTSNPSLFVTALITNGFATTNFVQSSIAASNAVLNTSILSAIASTNAASLSTTTNVVLALGLASTNFAGQIGLNSTNFTMATSNSIVTNSLSQLQQTNAALTAAMNGLFGAATNGLFVATTNGNATSLSALVNLNLGSKTNFLISTNIIGIVGSGSGMDGTYFTLPFVSTWTNTFNITNTILLSGGNYYIQSNGVSMYQSSNVLAWTIVNGVAPIPSGAFGSFWNMNGVIVQGFFSSTNLSWQITNAIGGFKVGGVVQGTITNELFSTQGSNTIFAIASTVTGPTNGVSAATVTNIASSLINTATNSLWSAVTNQGAVQWGSLTNLTAASRPATLYYFVTNGVPQYGILYTN
jgi:hypothetical protein